MRSGEGAGVRSTVAASKVVILSRCPAVGAVACIAAYVASEPVWSPALERSHVEVVGHSHSLYAEELLRAEVSWLTF
jgi:hypothetical protein